MHFPRQNIPENEKDEQWHLDTLNSVLDYGKNHSKFAYSRIKDHENYLIAAGEFDVKQFKYITDTYGTTSPARLVNFPIIMPKLDLLAGELISSDLQYSVNVVNRNAVRKKNEEKITLATEVLLRPIRREIEAAIGMPIPDEEVGQEVPPDIERYKKLKFRNAIEEMAMVGLNYCIQKYGFKNVFKKGFYDLSISGKEFYEVYIKNGDPYVERLDPRSMIYDLDSDKENLKDAKFCAVDNWYTINEIIDRYGSQLTEEQTNEIEELQGKNLGDVYKDISVLDSYSSDDDELKIRVTRAQWRSIRMLKHKVSENPYDPETPYYKKVKDNYKPKKGEKIIERPVTEIRQATKIGHNIIIDWGVKKNQIRFEENYAETSMDFHGVIKGNLNGQTLSVVDALKNVQLLYNIVMYQIELAMARSGGKSVVYDVSQKPKGVALEDVFYHAKNSGLILINNKAEGMQTNGFNQFQQVDFTLSQSVSQMINLKMMLEDTADKLTGISAARSGIEKSGALVGVTERNVMQSSLITAPLFDLHYQVVGDVLNSVVNLMRIAWANEGRMANVFGDVGMQTFKIDKSIALSEYGVFVENSGREQKRKQDMMALLERFSSTGNVDPLSIIKAVNADSSSEVESILTEGLEAVSKMQAELEERKVAAQEQSNEIKSQEINVPLEVAKINAKASIQVAQIKEGSADNRFNTELEHKENMQTEQKNAELDALMLAEQNKELSGSKENIKK